MILIKTFIKKAIINIVNSKNVGIYIVGCGVPSPLKVLILAVDLHCQFSRPMTMTCCLRTKRNATITKIPPSSLCEKAIAQHFQDGQ